VPPGGSSLSAWFSPSALKTASIGRQLAVCFGVLITLSVGSILLSIWLNSRADAAWARAAHWSAAVEAAGNQQTGTRAQMRAQSMGVALMDPRYEQDFDAGVDQSDQAAEVIDGLGDPVISQLSAAANDADHAHDSAVNEHLWPAVKAGDAKAANLALRDADTNAGKVFASLEKIGARVEQLTAQAKADAASAGRAATIAQLVAAIVTVILGVVFATALGRAVTRSARSLAEAAEQAAGGDLTVRAEAEGAAEFRRLGDVLNRMTVSLGDLVREIRTSSGDLSAAAQQISATAEEADHSTDGIARAMDDVAGAAERQVALVSSASLAANGARDAADEGRMQSTRASEAMGHVRDASHQVTEVIAELGEKSGRIGGIVSTITGLAEQTNLLALNAAIEAARAGDQGRGFAVVAEEVRKLAEESRSAAGSISELITEIQGATRRAVEATAEGDRRIQGGAETVEQSRDAFERIAESAVEVSSALGEVTSMAESTSAATEQVAASSQEMSASTRQVAHGADSLAQTAARLDELVRRFRV